MAAVINLAAITGLSIVAGRVLGRLWRARTAHWPRKPSPLLPIWFGIIVFLCLAVLTGVLSGLSRG